MPALRPADLVEAASPVAAAPHRNSPHSGNDLHVVFSAECIPAFDWQSVGLFFSFRRVRQGGKITRLLACSEHQLATYPRVNLEMGPTFVHENMRYSNRFNSDEMNDEFHDQKGKGYASYNKPFSVTAWLEKVDVKEKWILMMDTDMLLRQLVDPVALGVRRGNVVSAEYTYLTGTTSGFAKRFIDESLHPRMAQVGGFHIFHREDLRDISPRWLHFTHTVREFANNHPDEFFNESFHEDADASAGQKSVHHKQARWHTEMYGYVFAAAQVGVTHRIRRDVMLYPAYQPYLGRPPTIMHYGSDYTLGKAYFNKMSHQELRLETCPHFLFPDPDLSHINQLSKKDALTLEHLATLNAAFCDFYAFHANCTSLPAECGHRDGTRTLSGSLYARWLDEVIPPLSRCTDDHEGCRGWATSGECERNPLFMHSNCPVSCKSCHKPLDELVHDDAERGDWRHVSSERAHSRDAAFKYVASADEPELRELDDVLEQRRADLTNAAKNDDEDEDLHSEL